jgi:homoserine O-acetyltransferase
VSNSAWQPGDPPGRRRFVQLFDSTPLVLELGGRLGPVTVAYETWGHRAPDGSNAVLVEHALTGDSHVAGGVEPGHPAPGWWDGLIGPGLAIDTNRWWVVCANVLGGCQGTTGPSSAAPDGRPWGSRFPSVTIRDQVAVEQALTTSLGVGHWAAVIGGSMGGMRALEWAVTHPDRVGRLVLVATTGAASAEQLALTAVQAHAIRSDPAFAGGDYYGGPGPVTGLGLARRIGHISYRSEAELAQRFGRRPQDGEDPLRGGRYAVESYLDHHAEKLAARFDANSYLVLSRAMDHHDVGRGRGGMAAALSAVKARSTVCAISSDRLYPPYQQELLAALLPGISNFDVVQSLYGHDGFLIEVEQVSKLVAEALGD